MPIRSPLLGFVLLTGCAQATAPLPPFDGHETSNWLAQGVDVPGRDAHDLLPAFEANARARGCSTEHIDRRENPTIGNGELRGWRGIQATCGDDGTLALIMVARERISIGCQKPITRGACGALLDTILSAR